jgi:hypothetical protein
MSTSPAAQPDRPGNGGTHPAGPAPDNPRLRLRRDPLRLVASAGLWAAAWYLLSYLVVGSVLFAVGFAATTATAILAVTLAGLPLLVGLAAVLRGCANVERGRLALVLGGPVRGRYRATPQPGILAEVRTRWRDPATWRDVAYIVGLWVPLFILDLVVVTIWLVFLAGITLPVWYWAPRGNAGIGYASETQVHGVVLGYFPHGPRGPGAVGLYVDTLPKALLAAAGFLILFLIFNYVLVATARAHAFAARTLLRPPTDPLAVAKDVLAGPGPLGPLNPVMPNGTSQVHHPDLS